MLRVAETRAGAPTSWCGCKGGKGVSRWAAVTGKTRGGGTEEGGRDGGEGGNGRERTEIGKGREEREERGRRRDEREDRDRGGVIIRSSTCSNHVPDGDLKGGAGLDRVQTEAGNRNCPSGW